MMLRGGLRSEMSNRPIVEMSIFVTRVTLFSFPMRSKRDNELPVFEFGGKPCGVAYGCDLFHQSIWVVCLPRGVSCTMRVISRDRDGCGQGDTLVEYSKV